MHGRSPLIMTLFIGTFDAYKPKFGVGGKQNVKDTPRMLTPRETWQLKEKERKARSVQTMSKNKQRPTDEVPTNRDHLKVKKSVELQCKVIIN